MRMTPNSMASRDARFVVAEPRRSFACVTILAAALLIGCSGAPPGAAMPPSPATSAARATPTPSPTTPTTATPSTATVALVSAFEPAFTVTYQPGEWKVSDDKVARDVFLQYTPTGDALQFVRPDNVPVQPCDRSSSPSAVFETTPWEGSPADFIAWLRKASGSAITVSEATSVTLGNAAGLGVELVGKGSAGCAFLRVTMWADDNSLRISTSDPPSRLIALDVKGQTVLVWFHGWPPSTADAADSLLSTLMFR